MIHSRFARRAVAAIAALSAVACTDAPERGLSPRDVAVSASRTPKQSDPFRRPQRLAANITRSVTVGRSGGTLEIKEAGLKVVIPSYALPLWMNSLTVKVTALAGDKYAYEFEPSGTQFMQPLQVEQDMGSSDLVKYLSGQRATISYFQSVTDLQSTTGKVLTLEDLPTLLNFSGHTVKAYIWHFSGYIVCWS